MFGHESLAARVEVVNKHHAVVSKRFACEDLSQGHQVTVGHLLPLIHQSHTLGVDQSVSVDPETQIWWSQTERNPWYLPSETHVLSCLDIDCLVHCGHIAECRGFVKGGGWRGLQRAQTCKIVHLRWKIRECLRISSCVTYHWPCEQLHLNITEISRCQLYSYEPSRVLLVLHKVGSCVPDLHCHNVSWGARVGWPLRQQHRPPRHHSSAQLTAHSLLRLVEVGGPILTEHWHLGIGSCLSHIRHTRLASLTASGSGHRVGSPQWRRSWQVTISQTLSGDRSNNIVWIKFDCTWNVSHGWGEASWHWGTWL